MERRRSPMDEGRMVKWEKKTQFQGKNGIFDCSGVMVERVAHGKNYTPEQWNEVWGEDKERDRIRIYPLTGKGDVGRGFVELATDQVTGVIGALAMVARDVREDVLDRLVEMAEKSAKTTSGTRALYAVCHTHRHGTSAFLVRADHFPTEEEVVKACGIDYEPERDETIEISEAGEVLDI